MFQSRFDTLSNKFDYSVSELRKEHKEEVEKLIKKETGNRRWLISIAITVLVAIIGVPASFFYKVSETKIKTGIIENEIN